MFVRIWPNKALQSDVLAFGSAAAERGRWAL